MSNLTVQEVNGIEFYVSNDGSKAGVSQRGLAKLCGVSPGGMSDLINGLNSEVFTKQPPKQLEVLRGKDFRCSLEGVNLIDSKAAARIIRYYAYESKASNETARFSYDKFAELGMESWIKQVVGFSEKGSEDRLMSMMQELMSEVKELRSDVKDLRDFKAATVTLPGLQQQFDLYAKQEAALDSAPFTLNQWLESKGLNLSHNVKSSLGRIIADLYKVQRQANPSKEKAYNMGVKGRGWVTVYRASDIPMLQTALQKVMS